MEGLYDVFAMALPDGKWEHVVAHSVLRGEGFATDIVKRCELKHEADDVALEDCPVASRWTVIRPSA